MRATEATTASLLTASEVKSDLTFEISDLNYLHIHVHIAYIVQTLLTASRPTAACKQSRRLDLTSDLKSVASNTNISMCILLVWYGPLLQPRRSDLISDFKSTAQTT